MPPASWTPTTSRPAPRSPAPPRTSCAAPTPSRASSRCRRRPSASSPPGASRCRSCPVMARRGARLRTRRARRRGHRAVARAAATHLAGPVDGRADLAGAVRRLPRGAGRGRPAAKFFPLLMTAAGTVQPARVLVLGAGVAGLQAIATAKRLGAIVSAYDVRPAWPTRSARWAPPSSTSASTPSRASGGYAREMAEDRAERQRELLAPYVADSDVAHHHRRGPGPCRAAAGHPRDGREHEARLGGGRPGRRDRGQRRGLAARRGGRASAGRSSGAAAMCRRSCRCTPRGCTPRNVANLLLLMIKDGVLAPDLEDEIVDGCAVTHAGAIRHEPTRSAVEGEGAPA